MKTQVAILGGGCFWCLEAVFEVLPGVKDVTSGYAGGTDPAPTYEKVCAGRTGHAEVVRIEYDAEKTSYNALLDIFWKCHDPTTPDRQGADEGTQYRSIILFADAEQERIARESLEKAQGYFRDKIVTQIRPLEIFHPAEEYHQDYFRRHPFAGYCQAVIRPKLDKLFRL